MEDIYKKQLKTLELLEKVLFDSSDIKWKQQNNQISVQLNELLINHNMMNTIIDNQADIKTTKMKKAENNHQSQLSLNYTLDALKNLYSQEKEKIEIKKLLELDVVQNKVCEFETASDIQKLDQEITQLLDDEEKERKKLNDELGNLKRVKKQTYNQLEKVKNEQTKLLKDSLTFNDTFIDKFKPYFFDSSLDAHKSLVDEFVSPKLKGLYLHLVQQRKEFWEKLNDDKNLNNEENTKMKLLQTFGIKNMELNILKTNGTETKFDSNVIKYKPDFTKINNNYSLFYIGNKHSDEIIRIITQKTDKEIILLISTNEFNKFGNEYSVLEKPFVDFYEAPLLVVNKITLDKIKLDLEDLSQNSRFGNIKRFSEVDYDTFIRYAEANKSSRDSSKSIQNINHNEIKTPFNRIINLENQLATIGYMNKIHAMVDMKLIKSSIDKICQFEIETKQKELMTGFIHINRNISSEPILDIRLFKKAKNLPTFTLSKDFLKFVKKIDKSEVFGINKTTTYSNINDKIVECYANNLYWKLCEVDEPIKYLLKNLGTLVENNHK